MAPIKSSLARSVGKLLGVYKDTDLSLRGHVQSLREAPFGLSLVVTKPDTTQETIDIGGGSTLNFDSAGPYTVSATTSGSPRTVDILMWGAGGRTVSADAGAGGFASGKYTFATGTYYFVVGAGAGTAPAYPTVDGNAPIPYGGGGTGSLPSSPYQYHGGGFTGLFETSIAHGNAIIMAGGGGGAASSHQGGGGGGTTGQNGNGGGGGGTQSAGGVGGPAPGGTGSAGAALKGGGGHFAGGGGGGGYYGGGGGGGSSGQGQQTSGGGGSGYTSGDISSPTLTQANYGTVANAPSPYRNGAGSVVSAPQPGSNAASNGSPGRIVIALDLGL